MKNGQSEKKTIPEYLQLFFGSRIHKHPLSEIRSNKRNCATFCCCCRRKNCMSEWFADWLLLFFISGKNSQRSFFLVTTFFFGEKFTSVFLSSLIVISVVVVVTATSFFPHSIFQASLYFGFGSAFFFRKKYLLGWVPWQRHTLELKKLQSFCALVAFKTGIHSQIPY